MENITLAQVAAAAAIITALWVFAERIIKAVDGLLDKRLDPMKNDITMLMKSQLSMLEHLETGNHQEAMAKIRTEMQDYLLERGK